MARLAFTSTDTAGTGSFTGARPELTIFPVSNAGGEPFMDETSGVPRPLTAMVRYGP